MEKTGDRQTGTESRTGLVEQINKCLRSGDYSRALDLLRRVAAQFPNDAELSALEKLAQDGVKRNSEAQRLITESQEFFAQQKSAEAIQLLRKAYELDKNNSLARAILANALVEHAQSMVETDWLEAETLTNQALKLNPAHPTANTIRGRIVEQKKTSSVEDWVERARKLQSSGDLFAALAWVAEGLAVHPDDPKLLQVHDAIQRDQAARRRQARRGDVEDLRRIELEIDTAADVAAKQALAERIQAMAAKYWTDGEILSVANRLLHRLGFVPEESSTASPQSKGATVIFHVPRAGASEASVSQTSRVFASQAPPSRTAENQTKAEAVLPSPVPPSSVPTRNVAIAAPPPAAVSSATPLINKVPPGSVRASNVPSNIVPAVKDPATPPESQLTPPSAATIPASEPPTPAAKVTSLPSRPQRAASTNATKAIFVFVSAAAIVLIATTFFFTRRHYAPAVGKTQSAAPTVSVPGVSVPVVSAPAVSAPAQTATESPVPALSASDDSASGKVKPNVQLPAEPGRNLGSLLIVAGQDDARIFLNGKLQPQLTQGGQLRLPNIEVKDYVVQVSKSGFQDPPQQRIRIRKGEQASLIFHLQPETLQPQSRPGARLASLAIQGGAPDTTVLVDQTPIGSIQHDGTLSVSTVNPGDHTVELRKQGFKPRQLKEHFVGGGTISLGAADAALEAAPGELRITFTPADATVAVAKGDLLKIVSSGVPLSLAPGTYTLTARTAERFTRSTTLEVAAGRTKTLDLSLAPTGMSKWDDPGAWRQEKDSYIRKGGDFVLYDVVPASGTFVFSAMPVKGHLLQWVFNFSDPKSYVLFQMDEKNFYRTVVRNGQKTDEIIVPDKGDKKSFRMFHIRVSPTEIVHQIRQGDSWNVVDRWTQPGVDLSLGKFGFYIPGDDQVALSTFAHYADLNIR